MPADGARGAGAGVPATGGRGRPAGRSSVVTRTAPFSGGRRRSPRVWSIGAASRYAAQARGWSRYAAQASGWVRHTLYAVTEVPPELVRLRRSIDNIDAALIHLLAERFKATQAVGVLKAERRMPPADPAREEEQITRLRRLAQEVGLDPVFAEKFLGFVVAEVIRHHEAIAGRSNGSSIPPTGPVDPAAHPAADPAADRRR